MKQTVRYILCLIVLGLTACEKEPVNIDHGLSAALNWEDLNDKGREIENAYVWIFNSEGRQVVKRQYNSKQDVALDIHSLDAGEYKVVTAINLSSPFVSTKEDAFESFTIEMSDAKANPEHAHYSVATIRTEQGKNIRTPLPLRRILSELTVEIEGAPNNSSLEATVINAANGVMPSLRDKSGLWGGAAHIKKQVGIPLVKEQKGMLLTLPIRLMPTVNGDSYSYLSLSIRLSDGSFRKCEIEAPIMKSAEKYYLKVKYSELKSFLHLEPIQINDWEENWTVNGEILNPDK
ncbi:FimB/Mfa2 family fimbrial subunit [Bacteroides ihuae]|uniref:FimB/Mfa2 family fimbrial subunit n=1 Tax=Bacteroides ihuae TaxID=1852362 RepID=UPI0008DAAE03|nr:FimB/Mfa2 family fimbrial subunit [Bacteroides ihuae]